MDEPASQVGGESIRYLLQCERKSWQFRHPVRPVQVDVTLSCGSLTVTDISIVTLCDYDPMDSPLAALSASNKLRYANKHGYRLYFETRRMDDSRPPAWSKVSNVGVHF